MPVTRLCVYHVDNVEAGKARAITDECAHDVQACGASSYCDWRRRVQNGLPEARTAT